MPSAAASSQAFLISSEREEEIKSSRASWLANL
jgi:hypothetical protein